MAAYIVLGVTFFCNALWCRILLNIVLFGVSLLWFITNDDQRDYYWMAIATYASLAVTRLIV